jgi:uncharacterized tellurite resistance protein B-like protein
MMFAALSRILSSPQPQAVPDLRLSVAVLLLEAARQDDSFDARERAVILKLLATRFGLSPQECEKLVADAQAHAAQLVQLHGHTSAVAAQMTPAERIGLIEMLWDVAYADGVLDPEEDLLIRRIAGLIYVDDRERVLARQRAAARHGASSG